MLAGCDTKHQPPVPVILSDATGIDVHCHVFNSRDLPIPGFILHVVLEREHLVGAALGPLVTFLALMIQFGSRGSDSEIEALQSGFEPRIAIAQEVIPSSSIEDDLYEHARMAALAIQAPDAKSREIMEHVAAVLPRLSGRSAPDILGSDNGTAALLQGFAKLMPGGPLSGIDATGMTDAESREFVNPDQRARAAADGIKRHASNRSGVFYLAELITRPRNELVRRLIALPSRANADTIALITPALIDFSYWLDYRAGDDADPHPADNPADVTPLKKQVEVMSYISSIRETQYAKSRPYAVHPFVSFCPWRQVAEQQRQVPRIDQQFSIIKDAIQNKGFIGVKLYPVMGFRPCGNKSQNPSFYPPRLRLLSDWARKMDRALQDLYEWAVSEDVPIMAHCSFSQFPSPKAGRLGSPSGWWEVLAKFPTLRLNLAHCGGVWDLDASKSREATDGAGSLWPIEIIEKLGSSANLYADLADFSDVLSCSLTTSGKPSNLPGTAVSALILAVDKNPQARERLMYGTDYAFLIQADNTQEYLVSMRDCLAPALRMNSADLMGGNAARFLGLDNPSSKSRQRLDRFRSDNFLSRWTAIP